MPSPASPVVAAWELALRLRERRNRLGIEVRAITQALGFSRNYWSAVENERKILSEESLTRLIDLLEFGPEEGQELLELRRVAKERGWWTQYSGLLDAELQRLFGLEFGAHTIRSYESILIPGLLQTADYARSMFTSDVTIPQVEVEQRIEARLRRQERLVGEHPLRLTTLMSEAALRQQIGGKNVLRNQLKHLLEMIEQHPDSIDVRVIPFDVTSCGLFGAATVYLISFENTRLPMVIWQETVTSWGVIEDPNKVRDITATYREAYGRALSGRDTQEMIHNNIKELI